jgi:glucosamine kinase
MKKNILIVDSGSTKTDWCFINKEGKIKQFKTVGINPNLMDSKSIEVLIDQCFQKHLKNHILQAVHYYGAGIGTSQNKRMVTSIFKKNAPKANIEVLSDIVGAARSLCKDKKGVVCILGTGSNAVFYNGKTCTSIHSSLGYIAGDEGSGNDLGKRVLQHYAYKTFDKPLLDAFEEMVGVDLPSIITKLYKEPFPNRLLASFAKLLAHNRGHFMVENILEDSFTVFFQQHLLKCRQTWQYPIYFTGSISFAFKDVLLQICNHLGLTLGDVSASPMKGLITYHS